MSFQSGQPIESQAYGAGFANKPGPENPKPMELKAPRRLVEEKFISLLQSPCRTLKHRCQIQSQIVAHGFQFNEYITPKLVASGFSLGEFTYARKVFDEIPDRNVSLWNAMFKGYAKEGFHEEVVSLFREMKRMDVSPNCYTFPMILKSCIEINSILKMREHLHCQVVKSGFTSNQYVGTTLIESYVGEKVIGAAYKVFKDMAERNVVAWTTMVNGFISCRDIVSARSLFELAPDRDIVLWNTMISGYIGIKDMLSARELFDKMPNRDVMSWNTMLYGYANNGDVKALEMLFEGLPERNIFSWNALIGGYAHNRRFSKVLDAFNRMLIDSNVLPNDATLVSVLSACARLEALDMGKWVQVYAETNGYKNNLFVGNALVDMYAKCGVIEIAVNIFESMQTKDLISWNTIIGGLAMHGCGNKALTFFHRMKKVGEKPDEITFLGVLCACTHMGCVEDGLGYFKEMVDVYSIVPQIEHYGCLVDLLARAGLLSQAVDFVNKMPIEADSVIWATLLGAARVHKNVKVAELANKQLDKFEPKNPANHVMLSNLYGDLGRWKDMAKHKVAMKETGFKKLPGCSLIEIDDEVVEFYSFDERHPGTDNIYEILMGLTEFARSYVHEPNHIELDHDILNS